MRNSSTCFRISLNAGSWFMAAVAGAFDIDVKRRAEVAPGPALSGMMRSASRTLRRRRW